MTIPTEHRSKASVLKTGALAVIIASTGLIALPDTVSDRFAADHNLILAGNFAAASRAPAEQLPGWFAVPPRSSAVSGGLSPTGSVGRLSFSSLLPASTLQRHFQRYLAKAGYVTDSLQPLWSSLGLFSIEVASNASTGDRAEIRIRELNGIRLVEISYTPVSRVAAKGLSEDT